MNTLNRLAKRFRDLLQPREECSRARTGAVIGTCKHYLMFKHYHIREEWRITTRRDAKSTTVDHHKEWVTVYSMWTWVWNN